MDDAQTPNSAMATIRPEPVPYQLALRDYFKSEEPELWNWFRSHQPRREHSDSVRLDLLKSTYRIDRESHPTLYGEVDRLANRFGIDAPVTFYQAQSAGELNASLAFVPQEVHIVFHGAVLNILGPVELQAMLAHELSHFVLYDQWDGEFLVTSEVTGALAADRAADDCHIQTARLLRLYEEIFADRGSLLATEDVAAAVSTLIKMQTGLSAISADSYLHQAEEAFRCSGDATRQLTHPESYIRARALQLWANQREGAHDEIAGMIEGSPALGSLDLIGRKRIEQQTRRLISRFLMPDWLKTDSLIAHARLFFGNFSPANELAATDSPTGPPTFEPESAAGTLRDYYCYVLLDFASVDRSLEDLPLSAALVLARQLGLEPRFGEIAAKELGLGKKRIATIASNAERRIAEAHRA